MISERSFDFDNILTSGIYILKVQLHYAIYRLRFYSNSSIHILSLSNSHNNVASIQKNRGDKSHRVIVAIDFYYFGRSVTLDLHSHISIVTDEIFAHEKF